MIKYFSIYLGLLVWGIHKKSVTLFIVEQQSEA